VESGDNGLEHQAHARAASGVRGRQMRPDDAPIDFPGGPMRPHRACSSHPGRLRGAGAPKKSVAPIIEARLGLSPTGS
jgi:hypothetical protein